MYQDSFSATLVDDVPLDSRQLLDRCLGNRELALRVLNKFESGFRADWPELRGNVARDELVAVAQLAHRLKGSAASVSAAELAYWSSQLEQLARSRQFEPMPAVLDRLEQAWTRFLEFRASGDGCLEGIVPSAVSGGWDGGCRSSE